MDGILNVNKPSGMTSHDVVNFIRRCIGQKKVGHTGTLDPNAIGVLPICLGKATKIADQISGQDKAYRAELKLGVTTDTQDGDGKIIETKKVRVTEEEIISAVEKFIGSIEQIPPMYSAIKVNGKKLYELARKGIEIERKARKVHIYDIKLIDINLEKSTVLMDVECSKGTYIRTLCADIGEHLGCGAHMSSLIRTRSGSFTIEDSVTIEHVKDCAENAKMDQIIIPIDQMFLQYDSIYVNDFVEKKITNGNQVLVNLIQDIREPQQGSVYRIYNKQNEFLCLSKIVQKSDSNFYLKLVKSFY